jgi:hypothetical protein
MRTAAAAFVASHGIGYIIWFMSVWTPSALHSRRTSHSLPMHQPQGYSVRRWGSFSLAVLAGFVATAWGIWQETSWWPELLDRVVIDGSGVLPWWGTTLIKAGVAAVSPFLHAKAVIGIAGNVLGWDQETRADLRSASRGAFRRGFAEANTLRISPEEIEAPCPTLLVAGEGEIKPPVRASNAALAALMGNAEARYVPGHGHGWVDEKPDLHRQMVTAWITGDDLPSELLPESISWDRAAVGRLVADRVACTSKVGTEISAP